MKGASINAAFIVGPALAGLIAGIASPALAIEVQIAAGILLAVRVARDDTFELRPEHAEARPASVLHAVREGLAAVWRLAPLRRNAEIDFFYVLAWATLTVGFPAYAVAVGAGAHAAGYMWASVAAGSMVGGFALRLRSRRGHAPWRGMGLCLLAMAASAAIWLLAGNLAVALALIFLTGVLDGPALVVLVSIRQRFAPPHLRGQIFTSMESLNALFAAAGAAGAGLLNRLAGTDATLLAFVALIGFAGAASLVTGASRAEKLAVAEPLEATIRRP